MRFQVLGIWAADNRRLLKCERTADGNFILKRVSAILLGRFAQNQKRYLSNK